MINELIIIKGMLFYMFKGFVNSMSPLLPYHVTNPYEDEANSLLRDWKFVAADLRRAIAAKAKEEKDNV